MLFADFQTFIGQQFIILFVVLGLAVHFLKKMCRSNGPVASAAKDLAAKKAVGFLQRFLK